MYSFDSRSRGNTASTFARVYVQCRATKSLTSLLSRRGEAKSRERFVAQERFRKDEVKENETRRRTASRRSREEKIERRTCPSVHQPSVIRATDRLCRCSTASRALERAYHVASHLFTLTQYLLGRIGDSAVRSFARPASLFRERLPSFSLATTTS